MLQPSDKKQLTSVCDFSSLRLKVDGALALSTRSCPLCTVVPNKEAAGGVQGDARPSQISCRKQRRVPEMQYGEYGRVRVTAVYLNHECVILSFFIEL